MKLIRSSGTRLRVRVASALSAGGPQMPGPVRRIAPKPRRLTSISPPILNEPDLRASSLSIIHPSSVLPTRYTRSPISRRQTVGGYDEIGDLDQHCLIILV